MTFEIQKNIPIPKRKVRQRVKVKVKEHRFPFIKMEVGDSFYIPVFANGKYKVKDSVLSKEGLREQLRQRAGNLGMTIRTKEYFTGIRIWRSS